MSPEPSTRLPPIALLDDIIEWSNKPNLFWTHRAELGDLLHQYGRMVKQVIVWLKLRCSTCRTKQIWREPYVMTCKRQGRRG